MNLEGKTFAWVDFVGEDWEGGKDVYGSGWHKV